MSVPNARKQSKPKEEDRPVPLCYRCEWRAQAHETEHGPRYECTETGSAVVGCYMYRPVRPVVLKRQAGDRRPIDGPPIVSARSYGVALAPGEPVARKLRGGRLLVWWQPPAEGAAGGKGR